MTNILKIRGVKIKSIAVVLLLSIYLQGCLMIPSSNKQYSKALDNHPYDAIIVPGLPFENGKWGDLLKLRVYWASYLYANGIAKNVIFSGSSVYSPYVEAEIMAMYGEALGIPKENIYTETTAEHSTENLYYSYKLAKKHGFTKIALATDQYQGAFLYNFAKKKKIQVDYIPVITNVVMQLYKPDPEIPHENAKVENFVSIKERENFFQRLRGTRGKNIDFDEEEEPESNEQVLLRQSQNESLSPR